jgi:riboflavin kinase/FMN adenylyltransferase
VFEPLPREYFSPAEAPARLMSFREKFAVLRALGVDRLLRIRFDARFSAMGAGDFIRAVFVEGLGARHIVVGDDLRFGHDREGNIELLRDAGARFGFGVSPMPTVELDGERVSSTRLRQVLEAGDFAEAARLLGRPYSMSGKIVYGRQLGRTLGVPTANLELHRLRSPLAGIYVVEVRGLVRGLLPGVANVGTSPTVADGIKARLEVHLLDFGQNVYGRTIEVLFRRRIRAERRFASLDELKTAMQTDIAAARDYFLDG